MGSVGSHGSKLGFVPQPNLRLLKHFSCVSPLFDGSLWVDSNERENSNNRSLQESKSKNFSTKITGVLSNVINQNELNYSTNNNKKLYTLLRGGSWIDFPNGCRSVIPYDIDRRDLLSRIGFPMVCDRKRSKRSQKFLFVVGL